MIIATLSTLKGSETSTFYVIGESSEFNCGFRLWLNPYHIHTQICFRIRVEARKDAPPPWNFKEFASSRFPGIAWSGHSSQHVSLSGLIILPSQHSFLSKENALLVLNESGVVKGVYSFLQEQFPGITFELNDEEFASFFEECLTQQIESHIKPKGKGMVLSIGDFQKTFVDDQGGSNYLPKIHENDASQEEG